MPWSAFPGHGHEEDTARCRDPTRHECSALFVSVLILPEQRTCGAGPLPPGGWGLRPLCAPPAGQIPRNASGGQRVCGPARPVCMWGRSVSPPRVLLLWVRALGQPSASPLCRPAAPPPPPLAKVQDPKGHRAPPADANGTRPGDELTALVNSCLHTCFTEFLKVTSYLLGGKGET